MSQQDLVVEVIARALRRGLLDGAFKQDEMLWRLLGMEPRDPMWSDVAPTREEREIAELILTKLSENGFEFRRLPQG